MQKKDALGAAAPKSLTDSFKCGECLHFKAQAHSTHGKPCIELGIKAKSIAPSCFTPDVTQLNGNTDQLIQFMLMFQSYDPKQQRVMLALLTDATGKTKQQKRKFAMGTKLYFCVGASYISNYLSGYVAGYTSNGQIMVIGSPDKMTRGSAMHMYMPPESVDGGSLMTHSQWKVKRQALRDQGLVFDPANKVIKKSSITDQYEPPTLAEVPSWFYDKGDAPPKKRKRTDEVAFEV